jgi:DNA-binding GntR family transcriptional regulator
MKAMIVSPTGEMLMVQVASMDQLVELIDLHRERAEIGADLESLIRAAADECGCSACRTVVESIDATKRMDAMRAAESMDPHLFSPEDLQGDGAWFGQLLD